MNRTALPVLAGLGAITLAASFYQPGRAPLVPSAKAEAPQVATKPAAPAVDDSKLSPMERLALAKVPGVGGADKAVTDAQDVVRANPTKDDPWVVLGRAWVRKARESNDPGFYLNADAAAGVVLEKQPDHKLALDVRGLVLLNGHKFEEARALAQRIVDKHPEDPMAWGTLSDALLELGRYDESTRAAQEMVDLKPNLPSYSRASHLQWLHGQTNDAKATVRAALDAGRDAKRDPEPGAWVLVQAAMLFWQEGDLEAVEAGCEKALERVAAFPPANVCKGRVAMAKGEPRRAAELFERAYASSPLVETAWLLGDARDAIGDKDGAAKAYAMVEKEGKSDPRGLALFYATKNTKVAEAVKLAEEELAIRKDIYSEDALAWALYRAGKLDAAKAHITAARRLGTPDPRLVYHEGAIRIATGDVASGKKLVLRALELNKAFDATSAKEAAALVSDSVATR